MKDRTIRMGIVNGADSFGIVLGNILGGKLYKEFSNFYLNYCISIGICILSIIYILFLVPETVTKNQNIKQKQERFFSLSNIKQSFTTCFRDRPERMKVIFLLIDFSILAFVTGTNNYDFLMVRKR